MSQQLMAVAKKQKQPIIISFFKVKDGSNSEENLSWHPQNPQESKYMKTS
jgi:hypothetical protein